MKRFCDVGKRNVFLSTLRSPDGYTSLGPTLHLFQKESEEKAKVIESIDMEAGTVTYGHQHTFPSSHIVTELPITLPKLEKPGKRSV